MRRKAAEILQMLKVPKGSLEPTHMPPVFIPKTSFVSQLGTAPAEESEREKVTRWSRACTDPSVSVSFDGLQIKSPSKRKGDKTYLAIGLLGGGEDFAVEFIKLEPDCPVPEVGFVFVQPVSSCMPAGVGQPSTDPNEMELCGWSAGPQGGRRGFGRAKSGGKCNHAHVKSIVCNRICGCEWETTGRQAPGEKRGRRRRNGMLLLRYDVFRHCVSAHS